jgi:hypothetical protein
MSDWVWSACGCIACGCIACGCIPQDASDAGIVTSKKSIGGAASDATGVVSGVACGCDAWGITNAASDAGTRALGDGIAKADEANDAGGVCSLCACGCDDNDSVASVGISQDDVECSLGACGCGDNAPVVANSSGVTCTQLIASERCERSDVGAPGIATRQLPDMSCGSPRKGGGAIATLSSLTSDGYGWVMKMMLGDDDNGVFLWTTTDILSPLLFSPLLFFSLLSYILSLSSLIFSCLLLFSSLLLMMMMMIEMMMIGLTRLEPGSKTAPAPQQTTQKSTRQSRRRHRHPGKPDQAPHPLATVPHPSL